MSPPARAPTAYTSLSSSFFATTSWRPIAGATGATTRRCLRCSATSSAGTVGGPVVIPHLYNGRNKTFFFFSEQSVRARSGTSAFATVPLDAWRNGDFSGLKNGSGQADHALRSAATSIPTAPAYPSPTTRIPSDRLNPVAQSAEVLSRRQLGPDQCLHLPEQLLRQRQVAVAQRQVR